MNDKLTILKEGWLYKRGEFIKNWRKRYFILLSDGILYGFKDKPVRIPKNDVKFFELPEPLNHFPILNSQVMPTDSPKPNSFIIRCLQLTTIIERIFQADGNQDRDDWIDCIKNLTIELKNKNKSKSSKSGSSTSNDKALEDYEMIKVIGRGTFGKVILARDKKSKQNVAIKFIKKEIIVEKGELEHTMTENKVLQTANHPFLISLIRSFQTADRLCFVMEFINGGELFFHLSREKMFSEPRSKFYSAEIILALKYLHEQNVVYRDLKLENLLLDDKGHIKIADFGLCKQDVGFADRMKTFCGTPEYLAPEVIEDNDYGRAVDWWGLGVVMYEMICGRLPFFSRDHEVLFELILTKDVTFPKVASPLAVDLISQLLIKKPNRRLGGGHKDAMEIMRHKFYDNVIWDDILHKKITPPFVPSVGSSDDTRYFDIEFTNEPVQLTPPHKSYDVNLNLNNDD